MLPLVFDKLRNDGLRAGFERLDSPELEAGLEQRPAGKRLSGEMAAMARTARDAQGTATRPLQEYSLAEWLHGLSLQDVSEHQLDGMLAGHAGLWQRRGLLWATILNDAYEFRNWALRIKSTSKRPMLPVPFEKNMAAFEEILDVAAAEGVNVLVYIAPIRHDVEPPYIMAEYLPWKALVAQIVASRAGKGGGKLALADLDQLVSNNLWGTVEGSEAIDFMHFQGDAHVQLGEKIAALLAGMGAGRKGQD